MACRLAVRHADYNDRVLGMALAKVNGVMPRDAALVRRFVQEAADELTAKPAADQTAQHFSELVQAWIGSRKVEIDYSDVRGRRTTRVVHPYCLEPGSSYGHGIYLMAKDEASKQIRSFKLERVHRVDVLNAQYRLPPDFSLADELRASWGIWSSVEPEQIVLRFKAPAARRVVETTWHPSQRLRRLPGDVVEMTLRVRGTIEITPWILGWGPEVEVIQPTALREAVAGKARAMAATYGEVRGQDE